MTARLPLLLLALLLFLPATAFGQLDTFGRLDRHGSVGGSISPAFDTDMFLFHAKVGEGVQLRVANTNQNALSPKLSVYRSDGSYLTGSYAADVAEVYFAAPATGTYRVVIEDSGGAGDTGAYRLHYTIAPGANEHGALVNGGSVSEYIDLGDLDSYTFDAQGGDGVQLRVVDTAATNLDVQIWVYRPDGAYLTGSFASNVAEVYFDAPMSGTYTVLVMDQGTGGYADTGPYDLYYTRAPGANEHGALISGDKVLEQIDMGDLDSYTFEANQGEGIQLRLSDTSGSSFDPQLWVYYPGGSYYTGSFGEHVAEVYFDAPVTGTYTVVIMDQGAGGYADFGTYELHYTRAPFANEHGALINGGKVLEQIEVGDLDSYTFSANQGEGIQLRIVDTSVSAFDPQIWVYYPSGSYYTGSFGEHVAEVYFDAPATGTYTVVIMDQGAGGYADFGTYELHYTRAPFANEHGALVNGGKVLEQIEVGDLDSYTFTADQGDGVQLRIADTSVSAFDPQLWVYYPSGSYYTGSFGEHVGEVYFDAPVSGTYTVVVMDQGAGGYADSGTYELHYTRAPGANEHGSLSSGNTVSEQIEVGDLDSYTFFALAGSTVQLEMTDTSGSAFDPQVWVYRPGGSYYTGSFGENVATVDFIAPDTGTYTVVLMDQGGGGHADSGTYDLYYSNF